MRGVTSAILSISLLTVMAGAAMAPALGAIKEHFSSCSPMTVQLNSVSFALFLKKNLASLFEKCVFAVGKIIEKCGF